MISVKLQDTKTQKSVTFLYAKDETSEKERKLSHSQQNYTYKKHLGINLTKEVKDLANENC